MLTMASASRMVGAYSQLVTDLGRNNLIVKIIETAAEEAEIKDPKVSVINGPHHLEVLRSWSSQITTDVERKKTEQLMSHDSKVSSFLQALVASNNHLIQRLVRVEDTMSDVVATKQLLEI